MYYGLQRSSIKQGERVCSLEVDNISAGDHGARLLECKRLGRDVFVRVWPMRRVRRRCAQIGCTEKDHFLVAITRRRIQRPQPLHTMGCPPDLLFTLTLRGGIGRFAVIETARGHFPQLAVDCGPELSDQHHAAVGLEWDHDYRRRGTYA